MGAIDRREFLRLLAAAGGAAALAGCGASTGSSPSASAAASGSPRVNANTKVAISHLKALISNTPWAVGKDKGFYAGVGLTQEPTSFSGGGDTVRGLLQGGNDYASATPDAIVLAFVKGQAIRIIGGAFATSSVVVLAKKNSPIKTVKDLAGKRIGFSNPGSASQFVIMKTLRDNNVQANLIATGGASESLTALRSGLVDATWTVYPQPQRFANEFQTVFSAASTVPDYPETMLATTEDYARQHPEVLRAFLYAHEQAMDYTRKNPEESATIWAKFAGIPPQPAVDAIKEFASTVWTLKINPQSLKLIENSLLDFKQIDKPVDWKKLIVQDYLPADKRTRLP